MIGFPVGLYIDDTKGTKTSTNIAAGTLMFKNNIIAGCVTPQKMNHYYRFCCIHPATSNTTVLTSSADVMLADPYKFSANVANPAGTPSYLLQATSPALTGADYTGTTGFQAVAYRGAFDATNNWLSGWTSFAPESTTY